jgi:hypothetical protein
MLHYIATEIVLPLAAISAGVMIIGIFVGLLILFGRMIYCEFKDWKKK